MAYTARLESVKGLIGGSCKLCNQQIHFRWWHCYGDIPSTIDVRKSDRWIWSRIRQQPENHESATIQLVVVTCVAGWTYIKALKYYKVRGSFSRGQSCLQVLRSEQVIWHWCSTPAACHALSDQITVTAKHKTQYIYSYLGRLRTKKGL